MADVTLTRPDTATDERLDEVTTSIRAMLTGDGTELLAELVDIYEERLSKAATSVDLTAKTLLSIVEYTAPRVLEEYVAPTR